MEVPSSTMSGSSYSSGAYPPNGEGLQNGQLAYHEQHHAHQQQNTQYNHQQYSQHSIQQQQQQQQSSHNHQQSQSSDQNAHQNQRPPLEQAHQVQYSTLMPNELASTSFSGPLSDTLSAKSLTREVQQDVVNLKEFMQVARLTLNDPKAKTIAALSVLMLIGYSSLLVHAWNTNNQAMVGFLLLDFFNASCLMSEIIVIWVGNQVATFSYSFGFNQVNIVACFSICVLMLLMVFWNCVECMEHLLLPEHHGATHEPSLVVLVCAFVGRFGGLAIVKKYSTGHDSTPETTGGKLKHGLAAMIHATLGSGRVHRAVLLSRSVNSNALISLVSWAIVLLSSMLAPEADYSWVDPITSATVSVLSLGSVLPIMMNHARVLLQTVPANSSLWFKCLREVSNYDGVLEIKNQHLWLNGYKERVASLHVRIRRDANEQVVLAQLSTAFAHLCDSITIQIKKDDWGTGGSGYASTAGANSNFGYGYNTAGASHQPTDLNEKARQRLSSYSSNNLARTNQLMSPVPLQYSSPQQAQLSGGVPEAHGGIQFMAPSQDRGMNRGGGANGM